MLQTHCNTLGAVFRQGPTPQPPCRPFAGSCDRHQRSNIQPCHTCFIQASVVVPNQMEAELLTGCGPIQSVEDGFRACDILHAMGPHTVVSASDEWGHGLGMMALCMACQGAFGHGARFGGPTWLKAPASAFLSVLAAPIQIWFHEEGELTHPHPAHSRCPQKIISHYAVIECHMHLQRKPALNRLPFINHAYWLLHCLF